MLAGTGEDVPGGRGEDAGGRTGPAVPVQPPGRARGRCRGPGRGERGQRGEGAEPDPGGATGGRERGGSGAGAVAGSGGCAPSRGGGDRGGWTVCLLPQHIGQKKKFLF